MIGVVVSNVLESTLWRHLLSKSLTGPDLDRVVQLRAGGNASSKARTVFEEDAEAKGCDGLRLKLGTLAGERKLVTSHGREIQMALKDLERMTAELEELAALLKRETRSSARMVIMGRVQEIVSAIKKGS